MTVIASTTQGTDFHCGYYYIPLFSLIVVVLHKQMVCFGQFNCDGTIFVDGQLIVEP